MHYLSNSGLKCAGVNLPAIILFLLLCILLISDPTMHTIRHNPSKPPNKETNMIVTLLKELLLCSDTSVTLFIG